MSEWLIFRGDGAPHDGINDLPQPPNWRAFSGGPVLPSPIDRIDVATARRLGKTHPMPRSTNSMAVHMVNAALYLRRPLLVTGKPGTGKSALAYEVAQELRLGPVLTWPISSRSKLGDGLYEYDPIGRLGEENLRRSDARTERAADDDSIGRYLTLGPLGTALLPFERPRVLLIDEIDKSDIDLPNDLLNVFEEGEYIIPELRRLAARVPDIDVLTADDGLNVRISRGRVRCHAFPFIVMTSNDEREFPTAFLRRCLQLTMEEPDSQQIAAIVEAHLGAEVTERAREMIEAFVNDRQGPGVYATDQILSAIFLRFARGDAEAGEAQAQAIRAVLGALSGIGLRHE